MCRKEDSQGAAKCVMAQTLPSLREAAVRLEQGWGWVSLGPDKLKDLTQPPRCGAHLHTGKGEASGSALQPEAPCPLMQGH